MAVSARGALLSCVALACGARAFDTPLGGSSNEQPTFSTLGAGALQLAPPLTAYDADVRSPGASRGAALRARGGRPSRAGPRGAAAASPHTRTQRATPCRVAR